jgi:hypothetical protein
MARPRRRRGRYGDDPVMTDVGQVDELLAATDRAGWPEVQVAGLHGWRAAVRNADPDELRALAAALAAAARLDRCAER